MSEIEDHGDELYKLAVDMQADIATADYLITAMDTDKGYEGSAMSATPGMLVNWAMRLRPLELRDAAERLGTIKPLYVELALEEHVEYMRDGFSGGAESAGSAFNHRWTRFQTHLTGNEDEKGLLGYLELMLKDMLLLAQNTGKFQQACIDNLYTIKGLRKRYCEALVQAQELETDLVDAIIAGVAEGAGAGSVGGVYGTALGGLVGLVRGFVKGTMDNAADLIGVTGDADGFRATMSNLSSGLDIMSRSDYFDSADTSQAPGNYGESQWNPSDPSDPDANDLKGKD